MEHVPSSSHIAAPGRILGAEHVVPSPSLNLNAQKLPLPPADAFFPFAHAHAQRSRYPSSPSQMSSYLPRPPFRDSLPLSHNPSSVDFPAAPSTELAPIQSPAERVPGAVNPLTSLPPLSSLTGRPHGPSPPLKSAADHWPCLNPLTAYYTPDHVQAPVPFREHPPRYRMDIDMTGTQAVASPARTADGRASSVSLDDPDVRLAAEALGDLRAGTPLSLHICTLVGYIDYTDRAPRC